MGYQPKLWHVAVLAFGGAALYLAFLGGRQFQNQPRQHPENLAAVDLARDATELNKTLPEMVSEGVRLDRTSAGPGKVFHYFYTIIDDDQARIIASRPSRQKEIIQQLNERVCAMMPNYVHNGVVVKYHMKTRIDVSLLEIIVDPGACVSRQTAR